MRPTILLLLILLAQTFTAMAATPVAVPDVAFHFGYTTVVDVLANDSEADGDVLSVSLDDAGTCTGMFTVEGHLLRYDPSVGRAQDLCTATYRVRTEGGLSATATVTLRYPFDVGIFADDFETGNLSRWSYSEP